MATEPKTCPHCGAAIDKPRSAQHHRRLFAIIAAAFLQWRESNEFQPESPEHLRAWLLCKAGFRDRRDVPVVFSEGNPGLAKLTALAIEAAMREAGAHAFIRPHPDGGAVAVYRAKSIAWDKLGQKEFAPIAEAVEQILENELGVTCEQLLREKAA